MNELAVASRPRRLSPSTLFALVAFDVVVLDQITKWLAVANLTRLFEPAGPGEDPVSFGDKLSRFLWQEHPLRADAITVIENFWRFRYTENTGAAWGVLAGAASWFRTPFFLVVSASAMVFIVIYFRRTRPEQWLLRLALALVFGGAVGNFLDRVRLGYVIDFVEWHWYDKASWPIFNIADSAISVGVVLMLVEMLLHKPDKAKEA